ncbi:MAG: hypothetical protein MR662_01705 [Treponema porcinum]|uniref:hypothetical protein n=1 Tax=Treponema porcinum TaxID=261392 RepID=UPI002355B94E|nr:hypothetical protein [Treponema porcinum]MCI6179197.1 hypothetical protein [Treponema porcinum]MDD6929872.1 hypothetical protein [Treponema sp.]
MEVDIEIDGLTNCLINRATNEECDTQYRLISKTITKADAEKLKAEGWLFDWSIPHSNGYEIYELLIKGSEERQGLIALKHIRDQLYTHVDVVESAPQNRGKTGKYQGVGAHLFAIACKLSWDVGNEGFVQFKAKTDLVEHYRETLNAKTIDVQNMYIDSYSALNLIKKYFSEEA